MRKLKVVKFDKEECFNLAREYADLSKKIKALDERKKEIASFLKEAAQNYGVEDDNGSYYFEDDSFLIGKVAKRSYKLDQEKAVETLQKMGLDNLVKTEVVKVVDEDALNKAVSDGDLSFDVVEGFTDVSTSYMINVKEKSSMPEVKSESFKVAARKKKNE